MASAEVMAASAQSAGCYREKHAITFEREEHDVGGIAIDNHGCPLPENTVRACEQTMRFCLVQSVVEMGTPAANDQPERELCCHRVNTSNCFVTFVPRKFTAV